MKHFLILSCLLLAIAASGQSIQLPAIPDSLRTPESRAAFLVEHYWDLYPFGQSTKRAELAVEQSLVNYIDLFRLVPLENAQASLAATMRQASEEKRTLFLFYNLFEKYLYDLASPMRDERLFLPVLTAFLDSPILKEEDKVRPEYLLKIVRQNQVGSIASDFSITFRDGTQQNLLALPARPTLLYFYDPDCDDCRLLSAELERNADINRLIREGRLQIVAIYTGEDTDYWKETSAHIPSTWLCGYDDRFTILNDELYALPGFPTLYILDEDKRVVRKEASLEAVMQEIARLCVAKSE